MSFKCTLMFKMIERIKEIIYMTYPLKINLNFGLKLLYRNRIIFFYLNTLRQVISSLYTLFEWRKIHFFAYKSLFNCEKIT